MHSLKSAMSLERPLALIFWCSFHRFWWRSRWGRSLSSKGLSHSSDQLPEDSACSTKQNGNTLSFCCIYAFRIKAKLYSKYSCMI